MRVPNTAVLVLALGMSSCVTRPPAADGAVEADEPGQLTFHVAAGGNDAGAGTRTAPFATLERARDALRAARATVPPPAVAGVTVVVHEGAYELARPLEFTAVDSGTDACPIEYRAARGAAVRIVGGRAVAGWQPVSDPAVLDRLEPAARGQVVQADLKALGVADWEGLNRAGVYQSDPGLELFVDDVPMTLARYPNEGYMHLREVLDANGVAKSGQAQTAEGRFVCDDPRPARWSAEAEVWLHGFWVWDWSDERIRLGSVDPATNTLGLAARPGRTYDLRRGQWFYAENVLAELDRPGEWYLDRATGRLYLWPPASLAGARAAVSVVRDLVRVTGASHLTFRGFTVEAGRGNGFVIRDGTDVRVVACTLRNLGNWGVKVYGGTRHGVVGCDVYQTGQGGIHLEGGDRKTLTPAGHYAENNHIHHTSRWDPVYQQAIALRGVGHRATHNLIDNVPHIAIGFADNDMVIEYNEIHSAVFQSNDAGAIYTSPPDETWSMRGHRIRFNYLHNIHGFEGKGCLGVYLDDCFSSADISGNVFQDVATAILIGGGRDNPITNNVFLDCGKAFSIDARGLGWAKGVGEFATRELHDLNYTQPPWSVKYPELLGILADEPLAPKGNVVARNINWGGAWGWTEPRAQALVRFEDNLLDQDPGFTARPPDDLRLAADSPALTLGFQPIPFRRIGLYASPDRASWPVTSVLRRDPVPPAAKPKPPRQAGPPPVFGVARLAGPVAVDGKLDPGEWFGLDPARGLTLQQGVEGNTVAFPSKAWLAWDDEALYVAFDNPVSPDLPMLRDDAWGLNDAVEVALSNPALGAKAPILILRGFTGGTVVASDEAGAPAAAVAKAGTGVGYAASVAGPTRWTAEFRIPFAALGIDPSPGRRFPFSLAVRKQGGDPWVMWRGTGACTWYVPEAGLVHFVR